MYARIKDGEIIEIKPDLKKIFPHTSFKVGDLPDEFKGWHKVTGTPEIPEGHKLGSKEVKLVDGKPVWDCVYVQLTKDDLVKNWKIDVSHTDSDLPRWAEDMIDAYGSENLADYTKNKYNNKKAVRLRKPKK